MKKKNYFKRSLIYCFITIMLVSCNFSQESKTLSTSDSSTGINVVKVSQKFLGDSSKILIDSSWSENKFIKRIIINDLNIEHYYKYEKDVLFTYKLNSKDSTVFTIKRMPNQPEVIEGNNCIILEGSYFNIDSTLLKLFIGRPFITEKCQFSIYYIDGSEKKFEVKDQIVTRNKNLFSSKQIKSDVYFIEVKLYLNSGENYTLTRKLNLE